MAIIPDSTFQTIPFNFSFPVKGDLHYHCWPNEIIAFFAYKHYSKLISVPKCSTRQTTSDKSIKRTFCAFSSVGQSFPNQDIREHNAKIDNNNLNGKKCKIIRNCLYSYKGLSQDTLS